MALNTSAVVAVRAMSAIIFQYRNMSSGTPRLVRVGSSGGSARCSPNTPTRRALVDDTSLTSANRDERRYTDPDRFDVRRDQSQHLTFGFGLHFCLGAAVARLEGRVALEEILARFPEWDIDQDGVQRSHTSTMRGWESMPAILR